MHDICEGECWTYLEDIQTKVIVTHIRRKEESWNFKTWFRREIVVLRDARRKAQGARRKAQGARRKAQGARRMAQGASRKAQGASRKAQGVGAA